MRKAFIEELCRIAETDRDLWLLTGDLGFSVLEEFAERFPERYLNVGVAEQNMMGIAAGLALSGKRVVTYSIVNFATLRCLEQIRNDIVYHGANVTIVGVGAGFAYGAQGYTHHGIEDISVIRAMGEIDLISPADQTEARFGLQSALDLDGPAYLRLGKGSELSVHENPDLLARGRFARLRDLGGVLIIATGELVSEALAAADLLKTEGVEVAVWSAPWLSPIDEDSIVEASIKFDCIVTAEEAVGSGGLGAAVASAVAAQKGNRARVLTASASGYDKHFVRGQSSARQNLGLDAAGLVKKIRRHFD